MRLQTNATTNQTPARVLWPDAVAFREAIQNPRAALTDPELQEAEVVLDRRGLPLAYSGRFAVVFRLRTPAGDWALRCFTRGVARSGHLTQAANDGERRERYRAISGRLAGVGNAHFVPFRYIERGVRIGADWFPVVAMRWAEGETLGRWVEKNLGNPAALLRLAAGLTALLGDLEASGIAHGDWQHDNLLVSEDGAKVVLVDYDGMFVPELAGRPSLELGHPNYQHPARTAQDFGPGLDRFSCLVLQTALLALSRDASLWARFNDGESILFKRGDFADPARSPVFGALRGLAETHAPLDEFVRRLERVCRAGRGGVLPEQEPPVALPEEPETSGATPIKWWASPDAAFVVEPAAATQQTTGDVETFGNYLRRLTLPETLRDERQHLRTVRSYLFLSPALGIGLAALFSLGGEELPFGGMGNTLFMLLYCLGVSVCAYVGHEASAQFSIGASTSRSHWPVKRLYDDLNVAIHQAQKRIERCDIDLTIVRGEMLPDPGSPADFVTANLRKARTNLMTMLRLPGIDLSTVRALRLAGIDTAADLQNRTDVPGVSPDKLAVLQDWRDGLARKAAQEHRNIVRRRQRARDEIDRLGREIAGLQRELSDLQRERNAFPDLSFGVYLRRLLGLKSAP